MIFQAKTQAYTFSIEFPPPTPRSGIDIVAANVQRGRDHQLPTYPSYRAYCGYKKPETWTDMTDLISPDHVHRLFHIYASPADVDLYIGQGPNSIEQILPCLLS